MIRGVLAALLIGTAGLAEAAAPEAAAEAAERLRAAARLLDEAGSAEDRIGALTATIRAYEQGLGALRDALRNAALQERAIRARFDAEAEDLARILAALETLGRAPEADTLLHPSGGLGTARASMLMADVTPALNAEVAALRAELNDLAVLMVLRRDALETLEAGLQGIQAARSALGQAVSGRTELPPALSTDAAAMQALLNDAETLDAFAATLADTADTGRTDFASARRWRGARRIR